MSVKVAQVGCGHWGKNLARNFNELGGLAAVVDGNLETAQRIGAEHGVPVCTLDEVLADDSIDGVAFATPADMHADHAMQAIAAGKHAYVEKPLALDIGDAERVIAAAKDAGRVLMVGHLLQYHPIFRHLSDIVAAGELGDLRYIYSNRMSLGKFRLEENVMWSFAPHDFSMLLSLTGEEPNSVTAQGASFVTPGVADWATVQFAFPSGTRGHIQTSWLHPFKEQRLVVIGERAMAVFEDSVPEWNRKLAIHEHKIDIPDGAAPVPSKADATYIEVPNAQPLADECRHFLDCCASGSTPRTDGNEGLRVLRVLDAAERALQKSLER